MASGSNLRVTIGNLVAVVGIVLLQVFTFLTCMFQGDSLVISLLKSVGWAVLFAFMLWLMIKAKQSDENKMVWRFIEFFVLGIYIVVAAATSSRVTRFVNIYRSVDSLKTTAFNDIDSIQQVVKQYKITEKRALQTTVGALERAAKGRTTDELMAFARANALDPLNRQNIQAFKNKWTTAIDSVADTTNVSYAKQWETELRRCQRQIEGWSMLDAPNAIRTLTVMDEDVAEQLEQCSAMLPFPRIERNAEGKYDITQPRAGNHYSITTNFEKRLDRIPRFSIVGIIVCVIIHIMILFNYFIAYRSTRKRPERGTAVGSSDGITIHS